MSWKAGSKILQSDLLVGLRHAYSGTTARDADITAPVPGTVAVMGSGSTLTEYIYTGTKWLLWTGEPTSPFSFASGFSNYTSSGWSGMKVSVRGGIVRLNGAFAATSWAANATVLTLVSDYRPAVQQASYNCQVNVDGTVTVASAGSTAFAIQATWPIALV